MAKRNAGPNEAAVYREIHRLLAQCFNNRWCHHLSQEDVDVLWAHGRLTLDFKEKPTAAMVNRWSLSGFGHDSINCGICIDARCQREGVEMLCPACKGQGLLWSDPEAEAKSDTWQRTEPPFGEGWQMWDTVSEGVPISPVFKTPEELARYCADHPQGASRGTTYEQWLAMITGSGWVPSLIVTATGVRDGVAGMAEILQKQD